jgi:hypothetical protein
MFLGNIKRNSKDWLRDERIIATFEVIATIVVIMIKQQY